MFYDDVVPTSTSRPSRGSLSTKLITVSSVRAIQHIGIRVGIITNADARMRQALESLESSEVDGDGKPLNLATLIISEETGVEKPNPEAFSRACRDSGVSRTNVLHVGDELEAYVR
jgi:HAD superfamily hydrolase (TIGR01549 family)